MESWAPVTIALSPFRRGAVLPGLSSIVWSTTKTWPSASVN